MAISKNLEKFLLELLEDPSAIFDGIDTDALLNWDVIPNFSSLGKVAVIQ